MRRRRGAERKEEENIKSLAKSSEKMNWRSGFPVPKMVVVVVVKAVVKVVVSVIVVLGFV